VLDYDVTPPGIRLYKVHGSISWQIGTSHNSIRKLNQNAVFRQRLLRFEHVADKTFDTPVIWPGVYDEFRGPLEPIRTNHLFKACLAARRIVVVGYRFDDPGVKKTFLDAASENKAVRINFVSGPDSPSGNLADVMRKVDLHPEEVAGETKIFPECLDNPQFHDLICNS
jgi:hypothetical protein